MYKAKRVVSFLAAVFFLIPTAAAWSYGDDHAHNRTGEITLGAAPEASVPVDIHPTTAADGTIHLNNTICFVSHEKVSGQHFYIHEGVRYEFCCKKCIGMFESEPDKYALSRSVIDGVMSQAPTPA